MDLSSSIDTALKAGVVAHIPYSLQRRRPREERQHTEGIDMCERGAGASGAEAVPFAAVGVCISRPGQL